MIKGVHTMFYTSEPEEFRAFIRDKLGFPATDVGGGRLYMTILQFFQAIFLLFGSLSCLCYILRLKHKLK